MRQRRLRLDFTMMQMYGIFLTKTSPTKAQQLTGRVVTGLLDGGPRKVAGPYRLGLQRQVDKGFVLLTTAQRTQAQGIGGGFGQHYPFAATGRDETAGGAQLHRLDDSGALEAQNQGQKESGPG